MIKGVHTMFYSSEPESLRAFLRDKLGFSYTDVGDGWLIFDLPEADMGCHPADDGGGHGQPSGTHDISFYCDDIQQTVDEPPVADSVGYIIGAFASQQGAVDIGKFVLTLRADPTGRWLIAADMDNGNSR